MSGQEIARRPVGALTVTDTQSDWSRDQKAALAHLGIGEDVTEPDLKVFLTYAQRTGLDPFAKQIYLIGRKQRVYLGGDNWRWDTKYTIQTGIDGFRVVAARTGRYRGQTPTQWCGPDGQWRDVWLEAEPPAAARVGVLHADHDAPLYAVALLVEFMPTKTDKKTGEVTATGLWARMPAHMLAKCAEALALRQAFPNDLSGMYTVDEMGQAVPPPSVEVPVARLIPLDEVVESALAADTAEQLREVFRVAADGRVLDELIDDPATGERTTLRALITRLGSALAEAEAGSAETVHDAEIVEDPPTATAGEDWPPTATPADAP